MKAKAESKKSSRPSAGNSSSMSRMRCRRLFAFNSSVRRRPIWLRIRRTSGFVRLMSEGGTTVDRLSHARFSDTARRPFFLAIHMASKRKSNASSLSSRCHAPILSRGRDRGFSSGRFPCSISPEKNSGPQQRRSASSRRRCANGGVGAPFRPLRNSAWFISSTTISKSSRHHRRCRRTQLSPALPRGISDGAQI